MFKNSPFFIRFLKEPFKVKIESAEVVVLAVDRLLNFH